MRWKLTVITLAITFFLTSFLGYVKYQICLHEGLSTAYCLTHD